MTLGKNGTEVAFAHLLQLIRTSGLKSFILYEKLCFTSYFYGYNVIDWQKFPSIEETNSGMITASEAGYGIAGTSTGR